MEQVVPWAALVELIAPYCPEGRTGRPPFSLETMLRVHFMQQWFTLSDLAMEEAFFDTPMYREFAQLQEFARLPDERDILRFRHRLEKNKLAVKILGVVNDILTEQGLLHKSGSVVDATLIVDGASQIDAGAGMSAPENRARALKGHKNGSMGGEKGLIPRENGLNPII
jgi:IS5 family transposase